MAACPYCAEDLPTPEPARCPHCRETLDKGGAQYPDDEPKKGMSAGLIVLIVIGVLCLGGIPIIAIIAAIAIPNLIEARKHGNESAAIGGLKTISTAQSLFREGDKDEDGNFDYGNLADLSNVQYVDSLLGSGTKQGFLFACQASPLTPEFLWMATATPAVPGTTGDRYFAINQAGVIFYRTNAPIPITPDCTMPPDALPVGR